jgi:hypothetical protein
MTRSAWTLAFLFLTLLPVHARAGGQEFRDPHIRSREAELLDAVAKGGRVSPTL